MMRSQMINIEFKDISYAVQIGYYKPKKQILNGLSGFFRSSELTAIIGPSGAGKTTLLNILSGFQETSYTGTVKYYNGDIEQNWTNNKKQLCYIQQTNNLHVLFTVYEIMMFASYLKINRNTLRESRQMLIDNILNTLKLSRSKETQVGKLSGGEKKRLSIALELIGNPLLMFLDEPTTGLDASASIQCLTTLKTLTQAGKTIICSIHQPSAAIYEMFDHIYLVVNGHCMYRSSPGDTVDYFARQNLQCPKYHNPADYMMEVVSKEYGNYDEQLIAAAKSFAKLNDEAHPMKSSCDMIQQISENNQTIILTSPPTELARFLLLLQRYALLGYRDHLTIHLYLFVNIVIAVLLGLLYGNIGYNGSRTHNNITYIFGCTTYFYYTGLSLTVLRFPLEINILRKEYFNNWYQLRTYYVAMLVCRIPLIVISAVIFTFISYFMTSQPLEFSRFFLFLIISILSIFVSESMGQALSVSFNVINGTFIAAVILCVMMCFSGTLIFLKHMPRFLSYISYLSAMRYTFDGLMQSVYGNHREKLFCPIIYCHFRIPSTILEEFDMVKPMFWFDVVVLFIYFITFHILSYKLLKKRLSKTY